MERTRTDWLLVALIFTLGLFAAAQFGKISLLLPDLAEFYQTEQSSVAHLVSMVGIIGILFGVIAGAIGAKFGLKRVMVCAIFLGAALSTLQSAMPSLAIMTGLRLLEGFSHLAIVVTAPPIMAAAANDRHRAIAMSLWAMFFGVAFALLALILPGVVARFGISGVFLAHGVGLATIGLLVIAKVPKIAPQAVIIQPIQAHMSAYSAPRIAAPALGFVFYTLIYIALLTFLPQLIDVPRLGETLPLISLVGTFGAGWAARWIDPYVLVGAGFAMAVSCVLIALSGANWPLIPLFIALGIIPGGCFAAIPHLNETLEDRARASGVLAQMGNVGTSTGTPLFAIALGIGGLNAIWWATAAACVAGLLLVITLHRAVRRQR